MIAETPSTSRRQWRALVKKLRRKKIRQKEAQERDRKLQEETQAKLQDPAYQYWLQQQNVAMEYQREAEERQQQYLHNQWLRRELVFQQQFKLDRQRQLAEEAAKEAERLQQEQELEAELELKRQKEEERKRRAEEAVAEFERLMQRMEEFLADPEMEPPVELRRITETRPGRNPCQIFERTNCCRYGFPCVYNHRRPMLSRILVIRHFFVHPLLFDHQEYKNDSMLEYSDADISAAYGEFFDDVVPELEGFGQIVNFRTVCNMQEYLRGHVFVEYTTERAALKAFINLQGRYYAKKRLNVEFSNIVVWRTAVCGLSFIRKCPQGRNCLYLHLFSNPENKYNTQLEVNKVATINRHAPNARLKTPLLSWNDLGKTPDTTQKDIKSESPRNWRWSESPEVELRPTDNDDKERNESKQKTTARKSRREDSARLRKDDQHEKYTGKESRRSKSKEYKSRRDDSSRSHDRKRSRHRGPNTNKDHPKNPEQLRKREKS